MRDYIEEAKEIGEELLDSSMMVAVCSEKAAEESSRAASGADVHEATPSDLSLEYIVVAAPRSQL